jgi:predicted CXXCH cytochrome family protein
MMMSQIAKVLSVGICLTAFSVLLWGTGQKQPKANTPTSVVWKLPAQGQAGDYAGMEECIACHPLHASMFLKTVHAKAASKDVKYGNGCESCHGPGKAHVEAIQAAGGDDQKIAAAKNLIFGFKGKPEENSQRCLSCHITSHDQSLFERSEHKLHGVMCQSCHSAHLLAAADAKDQLAAPLPQQQFSNGPRIPEPNRWLSESLLRRPQTQLCFSCHSTVQAQFALPTHHRVPEGFMKCTDCHNAHGTNNQPMLRKTAWEGCIDCHTEKRGPFIFEHAAVKVEGCGGCHTPHGTVNRQLLLRREGRFLCLQCHVDPQAPNVPHGRLGFTTKGECARCHVAVHGSNFNQFFLN